jgi:hypothetical protein
MTGMAGGNIPTVGVICGGDAAKAIVWDYDPNTRVDGNNDTLAMLGLLEPQIQVRRVFLSPAYFRQPRRYDFRKFDLVWNSISDEVQNPKILAIAQKLVAEAKLPTVNPPSLIPKTSRAETAKRLAGIDGVVAPKVLVLRNPSRERVGRQVEEAGFVFPAILRRTGTHNGEVVGIVDDLDGLEPIFGDRKHEYNLIEFVDVRRDDGLYRKTRFFFVGDQVITRQHIVSDDWSVHGKSSRRVMSSREDLLVESRAMLIDGFEALPDHVRTAVHAIRERMGLEYLGLDCCIRENGEIVVFECNATMNFNPFFRNPAMQHNRAALPRYLDAVRALVMARSRSRIVA